MKQPTTEMIYARERGLVQSDSKAQVYVIPNDKNDEAFNKKNHKNKPKYDLYLTLKTNGFKQVPRDAKIEADPWSQQIVVGLVILQGDELVLMKCKKGGMEGKLTLVEGHVNPDKGYEEMTLQKVLVKEMNREFREEISYSADKPLEITNTMLKFVTEDNHNFDSISYRHIGFIYEMKVDPDYRFKSAEPKINSVVKFNINEMDTDDCDSWVKEIIRYYRAVKRMG